MLTFPAKATGSRIVKDGRIVGSELIGQPFDSAIYFSPRPSAISYNPMPSGGSNYGLTNQKLKDLVISRKKQFIEFNQLDSLTVVPSGMLFASGSGLDPHISPEAALLQVERIAKARNFNSQQKQQLARGIKELTESRHFLFPGPQRVNVLLLNLYSDRIK